MSKRRTEMQRLVQFFLSASPDEAKQALDVAKAIVAERMAGAVEFTRLATRERAKVRPRTAAVPVVEVTQ